MTARPASLVSRTVPLGRRRSASRRSATRLARPHRGGRRKTLALETVPLVSHLRAGGAWNRQNVLCLLVFAGAVWALLQCLTVPAFAVATPIVRGNKGLAASEIAAAARYVQGRNIFLIDSREVLASIEKLPGVKEAQVSLELPNRLVIDIKDQQAQVVWEVRGIQYLVDGEGEVIRQGNAAGRFLLIRDPDPKAEPLSPGKSVDRRAMSTVQRLDAVMGDEVKSYEWAANMGITVVSSEGWRAVIGWDDNLEAKLEVLRATVKSLVQRRESLKWIDVRSPERPSIMTSGEKKPGSR